MSRSIIEWLDRPEYIYQPDRILRRIFDKESGTAGNEIVELPWKLPLEVIGSDVLGRAISHHGIFELPVVETIFRLVDRSDTVLDIGANIGYMTAVAISAGAGKVISLEPHPALFARLSRNADRWNKTPQFAGRVDVRCEAVSSVSGRSTLFVPKAEFVENHGLSSLELAKLELYAGKAGYDEVQVSCTTLDSIIGQVHGPIGMLKIDVEGHESQAFEGARDSLGRGIIRDIVYESADGIEADTSKLLAGYGYSIFALRKSIAGPILLETANRKEQIIDPNLVATLDPDRVRKRMSPRGYQALRRSARAGKHAARDGQQLKSVG